ncbi:MAG TPA: TatD family hydrolase [Chitinophagaceae bacterium]|nr:TatD family hydrolase [Chitinophagaceae bacterium]
MRIVDSHAHIYLPEFDADRAEMLERADKEGVTTILMPAIDSTTHESMFRAESDYPRICISMMGVHPCSVREDPAAELQLARAWLDKRKFRAIGETGLDYHWDLTYITQQKSVFNEQISWALEFDIPVVIHSRRSIDDCIKMIGERQKGKLKGVFHCFSGTQEQAQQIMDLGFYLGIGGVVTYKNSGLDGVMKNTGLERIVLETDAPYLTPVPFRGKRNECSYLKYVVEKLSEIHQLSPGEIARITTTNAASLFGEV